MNGRRHGTGIQFYTNGNSYKGQWKDDCKDGTGCMKYGNGDSYSGGCKDCFEESTEGEQGRTIRRMARDVLFQRTE